MAEEEKQKEAGGPPAWMLTFADLVSLLICFFVLLFSMKDSNKEKWDEIKGALAGAFDMTPKIYTPRPDLLETIPRVEIKQADDLAYLQQLLNKRFQEDALLKQMKTERVNDNQLLVSMPTRLLFKSSTATLLTEGIEAIEKVGDVLRHIDNHIIVTGHTDPAPIFTSTYPTNWELSILRSLSVAGALKNSGVSQHIGVKGYADSRYYQIDPTLSQQERYRQARRVELLIEKREAY